MGYFIVFRLFFSSLEEKAMLVLFRDIGPFSLKILSVLSKTVSLGAMVRLLPCDLKITVSNPENSLRLQGLPQTLLSGSLVPWAAPFSVN